MNRSGISDWIFCVSCCIFCPAKPCLFWKSHMNTPGFCNKRLPQSQNPWRFARKRTSEWSFRANESSTLCPNYRETRSRTRVTPRLCPCLLTNPTHWMRRLFSQWKRKSSQIRLRQYSFCQWSRSHSQMSQRMTIVSFRCWWSIKGSSIKMSSKKWNATKTQILPCRWSSAWSRISKRGRPYRNKSGMNSIKSKISPKINLNSRI